MNERAPIRYVATFLLALAPILLVGSETYWLLTVDGYGSDYPFGAEGPVGRCYRDQATYVRCGIAGLALPVAALFLGLCLGPLKRRGVLFNYLSIAATAAHFVFRLYDNAD